MDTILIILLSFVTPILVVILVYKWTTRSNKKLVQWAKENREKQAKARHCNAKIISVKQGVTGGQIKRLIYFDFEILDPIKPYKAAAAWFVDTLHFNKIQEGNTISVKVDVDDPMKIYPADSWAVYTEGYEGLKGLSPS